MARCAHRSLSLACLAAAAVLSGCATTYNSAGESYISVWPFIGSQYPNLQLNYPPIDPAKLELNRQPDPLDWMSPHPPVDRRVTNPYSQADDVPATVAGAAGDNANCAARCESTTTSASLPARAD